jgi:hypothetical protein
LFRERVVVGGTWMKENGSGKEEQERMRVRREGG